MPHANLSAILGLILSLTIIAALPVFRSLDSSDANSVRKLELEARGKPAPAAPVYTNIVYKRRLFRALRLDIYPPLRSDGGTRGSEAGSQAAPVIVFYHGGSWIRGDKITIRIVDRFLERMRSAGYAIVAVNYTDSLLRGLSGPVANARDAVRWVAEHADEYGFDRHRIGLYGVSAGGHVALMAAAAVLRAATGRKASDDPASSEPSYRLAFVFAECAPTDLVAMRDGHAFGSSGVFRAFPEARLRALSPIYYASAALPPILLFHGDADRTVDIEQSRLYAEAVRAAGGDIRLVEYPGGDHAFLGFPDAVWYEQESVALHFFAAHFAVASEG